MLAAGIAVRAREESFGGRVPGAALIYPALGGV
ncbi:hypothetical protein [Thalassospira sp. MIT1004]|nr:hypothetical protein [Thalassospira sp. MIT1004]